MFKKVLSVCAAVVLTGMFAQVSLASDATQYEEGTHYKVRTDKLTKTKEIREFFSFWCGHCFSMQETFDKLRDSFPEAKFERNPVSMLGGPMGPETQRALVVASNLGLEDEFVHALFKAMHLENKIPLDHKELANFVTTVGIPVDRFEKEFNSFVVIGRVAQFDKWGKDIDIEAVPELLVNGKYLVTMESVNSDEELIALVSYLLKKDNLPDAAK